MTIHDALTFILDISARMAPGQRQTLNFDMPPEFMEALGDELFAFPDLHPGLTISN